jgi:hypothetical protein
VQNWLNKGKVKFKGNPGKSAFNGDVWLCYYYSVLDPRKRCLYHGTFPLQCDANGNIAESYKEMMVISFVGEFC